MNAGEDLGYLKWSVEMESCDEDITVEEVKVSCLGKKSDQEVNLVGRRADNNTLTEFD